MAGTTTPTGRWISSGTVFGYAKARSEILHWNTSGTAATTYKLGCDINGTGCKGGTTTTPRRVASPSAAS